MEKREIMNEEVSGIPNSFVEKNQFNILLVENDENDFLQVWNLISEVGDEKYQLKDASGFNAGLESLKSDQFDLCVVFYDLDDKNGSDLLLKARKSGIEIPFILIVDDRNQILSQISPEENAEIILKSQLNAVVLEKSLRHAIDKFNSERQLSASRELYRTVVENAIMPIMISRDGRLLFVNQSTEKLSGYTRQELLSKPFTEFIHPEDRDMIMKYHLDRIAGKEVPGEYNFRIVEKSGQTRWVENKSVLIEWEDKPATLNFLTDITERKNAQEELANMRALLQAAIEQTPAGIVIAEAPDVKIKLANSAALEIQGEKVDKLTNVSVQDTFRNWNAFYPDGRPYDPHDLPLSKAVLKGETSKNVDVIIRRDDGEERWIYGNAAPVRNAKGEIIAGVVVFPDVTDIKKSEADIRESEAKYRTLFDTASDAIFIMKRDRFIDCNAETLRIFGCTRDQILNCSPFEFSPEYQPDGRLSKSKGKGKIEAVLDGKPQSFEWLHTRYDGTPFEAEINLGRMDIGKDDYILAIVRDITERKKSEKKLRESEEKFRNIYNNAQIGLFRTRIEDGMVLECNDRFADIMGYTSAEECMIDFVTQEHYVDPGTRERMIEEIIQTSEVRNFEARLRCTDGKIRWVRYSACMYEDKGYIEGVAADITQEKMAYEMLRLSNQRVVNILASISDGFFTLDEELTITYFNKAAEKNFECKGSEIIGYEFFEAFPGFKGTTAEVKLKRVLTEKRPFSFEVQRNTNTPAQWFEFRAYPAEEGISVYFQDITERKHYEHILQEKEHKLRSILRAAGEAIIVVDREGKIDSHNPVAKVVFGFSRKELNGENITTIIPEFPYQIGANLTNINKNRDESIAALEMNGLRANGESFPLKITVREMALDGQNWYTIVARDMTKDLHNMQKLMEMDKFSAIGTLAGGVAHEFKNYLAGIIGNASFALQYIDSEDGLATARDTLKQVIEIGENANRIALSLLTYSRDNTHRGSYVKINRLIDDMLKMIRKEAASFNINISTKYDNLPDLLIPPGDFQQMMLNLVLNAREAIGRDGEISISTALKGSDVEITIEDSGRGIPQDELKRIFDPFYSTKGVWGNSGASGTGLGLSISKNIALKLGGDIKVESVVGKGSTFAIRIPVSNSGSGESGINHISKTTRLVLLSSHAEIIEHMKKASEFNRWVFSEFESISEIEPDKMRDTLFVLDAEYPGMGELFRIAEYLRKNKLRFIIINTGQASESQLQGLFDNAEKVYQELPRGPKEILSKV
ncbi:MAG: PAS domain S-box protein [candidate division Zixibacteria bacterium]|nr:PAS domain S-box protein [candidate division Zixibacteria bacterium]